MEERKKGERERERKERNLLVSVCVCKCLTSTVEDEFINPINFSITPSSDSH